MISMIGQLVRYQVGVSDSTFKVAIKNLDADFDLIPTSRTAREFTRTWTVEFKYALIYKTRIVYAQNFVALIVKEYFIYARLLCRSSHAISLELSDDSLPTAAILTTSLSSVRTARGRPAFTFVSTVRFPSHRDNAVGPRHINV